LVGKRERGKGADGATVAITSTKVPYSSSSVVQDRALAEGEKTGKEKASAERGEKEAVERQYLH